MFWEGANLLFSNATNTSAVLAVISEATLENVPNPTVIRIRGRLSAFLTAVASADTILTMTYGIMVVDEAALAIGVTALQLPGTDIGSDWMWWDTIILNKALNTGPEDEQIGANKEIVIDNKAMRKIGLNQALVLVAQNTQNSGGAGTVASVFQARVLVKR